MTTYSRLLLICHPDLHPSPAMARAQALASGTGATLHLVVLSQLPSRLATLDQVLRSNARKQDAEHRKAWLAEQVAALGALGITAYAETVDEDDPLKDLIHLAQLHRVEMVIKDIKHETALSRALLTPLDWQLLRRCPIPLHLVAHAEPTLPTRVIAAVELAENGQRSRNSTIASCKRHTPLRSAVKRNCTCFRHTNPAPASLPMQPPLWPGPRRWSRK